MVYVREFSMYYLNNVHFLFLGEQFYRYDKIDMIFMLLMILIYILI